jgi:hypothetical protein
VTPTISATTSPTNICIGSTATLSAVGALTYTWNPGALTGASVVITATANTTYTVIGTNAAGCVSTTTISLNAKNNPTVTATASPSLICRGNSSTLTAGQVELLIAGLLEH